MDAEAVSISVADGVVALTMNRVCLDYDTTLCLIDRIEGALAGGARIFVIRGRNKCFSTGTDLKDLLVTRTSGELLARILRAQDLILRMLAADAIFIAAINGYCLGGGLEMALACDIRLCVDRIAAESQASAGFLGFPELKLGLIPALGGISLAKRLIGSHGAHTLIRKGDRHTAQEAREAGLVDQVAPPHQFEQELRTLLQELLLMDVHALCEVKRVLHRSLAEDLGQDMRLAAESFCECAARESTRVRIMAMHHQSRMYIPPAGAAS